MSPAVLAVTAHAANAMALGEEMVPIPIAFEMVAVIVAAASGVLAARENKLDLIGAIGLAVLVSLGGGLTRDVILQEHNVYILQQPLALPVSIGTAAAVFAFPWMVEKPDRLISVLDIFAVGLFAVMGADKTMAYGYPPITCVMMASSPPWAAACCAIYALRAYPISSGAATCTPWRQSPAPSPIWFSSKAWECGTSLLRSSASRSRCSSVGGPSGSTS